MVNRIGVTASNTLNFISHSEATGEGLCAPLGLNLWYISLTLTLLFKLLLSFMRYNHLKRCRQESIPLYFINLFLVNMALTTVFIKGNFLYFSDKNKCMWTDDALEKVTY